MLHDGPPLTLLGAKGIAFFISRSAASCRILNVAVSPIGSTRMIPVHWSGMAGLPLVLAALSNDRFNAGF